MCTHCAATDNTPLHSLGSLFKVLFGERKAVVAHWSLALSAVESAALQGARNIKAQYTALKRIGSLAQVCSVFLSFFVVGFVCLCVF
jgi:hypothetical protein